jgi:hypothetical protein
MFPVRGVNQNLIGTVCKSVDGCAKLPADLVALPAGGFIPPDRACQELQAQVKAAAWAWLAIDHSRRLREFARQRGKQRFFARLPVPLGNHPSAVRADVTREGSLGNTGFLCCCQVYRELRGEALLDPAVEKHSTEIGRWSGGLVHGSRGFAQRKRLGLLLCELSILLLLVLCHRNGTQASSQNLYFPLRQSP